MKIIICKYAHCHASKKSKPSAIKKFVKRMLNKKRRRNIEGKVYKHMRA